MENQQAENKNPTINRLKLDTAINSNYSSSTRHDNIHSYVRDTLSEFANQITGTVKGLEAIIVEQNKVIMEALATQKVLIENITAKQKYEKDLEKIFPILTVDDLAAVNSKIIDSNRAIYTRSLSSLLKGQLHKTLKEVLSVDVILACNISGIHGKLSLQSFKRLFDTLMDAIRANGCENPEESLRIALKLIKKRHFQAVSILKTKKQQANELKNTNKN